MFVAAVTFALLQQSRAQAVAPQSVQPQNAPVATTATPAKARTHRKKATPVAEVPPTPPPPPTLAESPPTPPRISYQNGQLTIDAHNATLSQVLRAVQVQTGASMEIPGSANSERVVAQLGPGQPRDVLNTLLNGSKFDYVILGVTGNPGAVQRVILTPRQNSAAPAANSAQNNNPPLGQEPTAEEEPQPDEGVQPDTTAMENQNPEQSPPPPGGFRRPGAQQPGEQSPFGPGESQNVVKTPEQLMQELQQMQQQQQQYQQQLNPANQNPPQ